MVCYYCKSETSVINSRLQKKSNNVWRRRKCLSCGQYFTTIESADLSQIILVEDSSTNLEPFRRDKLFLSLITCLDHTKNPFDSAKSLTDTIISKILLSKADTKISTDYIKYLTIPVIARFDKLAADKYASKRL